jgi:hypothetical protein
MAKTFATLFVNGQKEDEREYPLLSRRSVLALAAKHFKVTSENSQIHYIRRTELVATRGGVPVVISLSIDFNLKQDILYKGARK